MEEVFPAQAGVIPPVAVVSTNVNSIPRASGGDPENFVLGKMAGLYSPRKRG